MYCTSEHDTQKPRPEDSSVNFFDMLLVVSRHIRVVLIFTLVVLLVAIFNIKIKPAVYFSNSKLMVLEFVEKTKVLRVGDAGKLVLGPKQGDWNPADVFAIKEILNSSKLKTDVRKKLLLGENVTYTVNVLSGGQIGVVTFSVTCRNQELAPKIVTATIEEAGHQAYRLGLLSSPTPVVDNMPDKFEYVSKIIYLLELASPGREVRSSIIKAVLMPTLIGFSFILCIVFILDFFQNLNNDDRHKISMIKSALRGKKDTNTPS